MDRTSLFVEKTDKRLRLNINPFIRSNTYSFLKKEFKMYLYTIF